MKGKVLFVAGLATGYVLGTRAGRERYRQIETSWAKVWNAKPVQKQVGKVEDFAKARASEVPGVLLNGAKKVVNVVTSDQSKEQKVESAKKAAVDTASEIGKSVKAGTKRSASATAAASADTSADSSDKTE